ncbi:hypothetical protein J5X84_42025 [Streptosporangiaceae bacterium NEAU-GS5]|nr:hypothetical protein [Streptosporangiaceae bacterium NEAU-GS5]
MSDAESGDLDRRSGTLLLWTGLAIDFTGLLVGMFNVTSPLGRALVIVIAGLFGAILLRSIHLWKAGKLDTKLTTLAAVLFLAIAIPLFVLANSLPVSTESGAIEDLSTRSPQPNSTVTATVTVTATPSKVPQSEENASSEPSGNPSNTVPSSQGVPSTRYKGAVSISSKGDKDLDHNPPIDIEEDGEGGDFSYNFINGQIYSTGGATWAKWSSAGVPSYSDCATYADAAGVNTMELRIGDITCVRTSERRVARLKLIKYPDCYCAVFDAVIWD